MAESNQSGMFKKLSVAGSLFRSAFVRSSSSDSSPQTEPNEENGWVLTSKLKENDVLQPFTAGWQLAKLDPFIVEKSKGCYLYDSNGKRYLDAMAGLWCTSLGGSESRLVAAATAQLSKLPFYHSFSDCMTNPTLELAKELIDLFTPTKMGKVFFTNSGSEANDSQVKVVRYYNNALGRPNKKKFISRLNSYHGTTVATASLSGLPILHKKFDLPEPFVVYTDNAHYWRFHLPDETEEDYSSRLANNLENLILKEGPDTIAAFIAEPVMGGGGAIIPPKTYFEKIQAILRKYDILLIIDEVITGFGRVGTMFACEQYNIQPDLLSIAKALSSGYVPIGAILLSPKICEVILAQSNKIGTFAHGFTYSGHPVPCAVALETLKIYKERNIIDHVQAISPRFVDGIKAFSNSPIIGEVRGIGLILGTTFSQNKSPNDMFPLEWGVGHIFEVECRKRGLLVHAAEDDTVVLSPPLVISSKEVDELISIFGEALKSTEEKVEKLQADKKNCLVKYP